jgi:RsiW-degrading membrane proteinase PrsW (M82 family)
LPCLISLAWLSFIRRFDRAHPEPLRLVLLTFFLGAVAVLPAGAAEWALERVSPYFSTANATAGGGAGTFLLAVPLLTFTVGFAEEASKFLVVWLFASRTKEFDEPVDGIVYGVAASLGFATIENMKFFALARLAAPVIVARSLLTVPAHMFFGTLWGYALGRKLVQKKTRVVLYLLAASVAHGVFDASLGTRGFWPLALLVNGALTTAFVVLVRRALRRGVVSQTTRIVESTRRALFSVGKRRNFALSLFGLYAFGALLFLYTATYMAGETLTLPAVLAGTALAGAVGVSAYAIPTTMPLDVAVDATGITYAGSAIGWSEVRGLARPDETVFLIREEDAPPPRP